MKLGGHNIDNLRQIYDTVLIAEKKEDLQEFLDIVEEESRKKGKKTEVMVVSQSNECPQINIFINGNKFKQRDQFKYSGTLILNDGYNTLKLQKQFLEIEININK